jgi:prolyl oligopeptidase
MRIDPTIKRSLMKSAAILMALTSIVSCGPKQEKEKQFQPPQSAIKPVYDTLYSQVLRDDYRWLEDGETLELQAWTDAQNNYTRSILDTLPQRETLKKRFSQLLDYESVNLPAIRDSIWYYTKQIPGKNQSVLIRAKSHYRDEHILLDPNLLQTEGIISIDWFSVSPKGTYLAYGLSEGGSELSTLYLMETKSGKVLADTIPQTRACSIAWLPDENAFYYTRYPLAESCPEADRVYYRHIWHHKIGDDYQQDAHIFGKDRAKEEWPELKISPDGRWLFTIAELVGNENELLLLDRKSDKGWQSLTEGRKGSFIPYTDDHHFYILSNYEASNYRIFKADYTKPGFDNWQEIIPESAKKIEQMAVLGENLAIIELEKAMGQLSTYSKNGRFKTQMQLPQIGSVRGLAFDKENELLFTRFQSYNYPPAVWQFDEKSGDAKEVLKTHIPADLSDYEVRQASYTGYDGVEITMFIVHQKGLQKNGDTPTLLYGYGGFNISLTPNFSASLVPWLEAGGIYAVAHLRGGGEYGEAWHQAGMLHQKQNTFNDFIAAAEFLIAEGYTSKNRLAIAGGSNGGLLTGAAVTQRPDLFKAVIIAVPLLDMVRYHLFSIARLWIPEYGSSETKEGFQTIIQYSPYQKVQKTAYPATFLLTADSDTRVDPLHARKMAAKMQATNQADTPIIIRIEKQAGHGKGKPISKRIDELADRYAFLAWQTGLAIHLQEKSPH